MNVRIADIHSSKDGCCEMNVRSAGDPLVARK